MIIDTTKTQLNTLRAGEAVAATVVSSLRTSDVALNRHILEGGPTRQIRKCAEPDEAQTGGTGTRGECGAVASIAEVRSSDLDMVRDASSACEHRSVALGVDDGGAGGGDASRLPYGGLVAIRADDVESGDIRAARDICSRVSSDLVDVGPRIANGGFGGGGISALAGKAGVARVRLQLHTPLLMIRPLANHNIRGGAVRLRSLGISRGRHLGHEHGQAEEAGEASDGADEIDRGRRANYAKSDIILHHLRSLTGAGCLGLGRHLVRSHGERESGDGALRRTSLCQWRTTALAMSSDNTLVIMVILPQIISMSST